MDANARNRQVTRNTFTADNVLEIRQLAAEKNEWGRNKWTAGDIQQYFVKKGITCGVESVRRIIRGETWAFLTQEAVLAAPMPPKEVIDGGAARLFQMQEDMKAGIETEKRIVDPKIEQRARNYGSPPKRD